MKVSVGKTSYLLILLAFAGSWLSSMAEDSVEKLLSESKKKAESLVWPLDVVSRELKAPQWVIRKDTSKVELKTNKSSVVLDVNNDRLVDSSNIDEGTWFCKISSPTKFIRDPKTSSRGEFSFYKKITCSADGFKTSVIDTLGCHFHINKSKALQSSVWNNRSIVISLAKGEGPAHKMVILRCP